MNKDHLHQDAIFNTAMEMDYTSLAFELIMNEPDFWVTAARWLTEINKPQVGNSPYQISAKKMSKVISLLTAQPSNKACDAPYEDFVVVAHDFLATASNFMLNAQRQAALEMANSPVGLPTYSPSAAPSRFTSASELLASFNEQVRQENSWGLTEEETGALATFSERGEFPFSLVDPQHLYFQPETGSPIASFENMKDKNQLKILMACLLKERSLDALFEAVSEAQLPGSNISRAATGCTGEEIVASYIKSKAFKDAFSWDWRAIQSAAGKKILAQYNPSNGAEISYTTIADPVQEYRDPEDKSVNLDAGSTMSF